MANDIIFLYIKRSWKMNIFRIEKTDKYYLIYIFKLKLSFSARKNYLKERLCFIEKIKGLFLKDKKYYETIIPAWKELRICIKCIQIPRDI